MFESAHIKHASTSLSFTTHEKSPGTTECKAFLMFAVKNTAKLCLEESHYNKFNYAYCFKLTK